MFNFFFFTFVFILLFESVLSCTFPNGTDTKIHFFNCDNGEFKWIIDIQRTDAALNFGTFSFNDTVILDLPIIVENVEIFGSDGNQMYPIDPKKSLTFHLTAKNNGIIYDNIKINAKLYSFDLEDCEWTEFLFSNLLKNVDGCKFIKQCPLENGNLERKFTINMSLFGDLIGFLSGDEDIFQFEIQIFNDNQGSDKEKIGCAVSQFRLLV